ncbi:MAG: hypothetical protein EP147_17785 [Subdoligranulum sp.]|nr:hypothetical protein [Subdoligranulum sp.]
MTKTEARKLAKACRAAVDLHTVGHAMAGVLFALPAWQRADTVLAFASMPDEPDTADILRQALAESKRLLLPRVLSRTEMDWVEITALSQLQPGAYGILEAPASCLPLIPPIWGWRAGADPLPGYQPGRCAAGARRRVL